jgi:hypothetical protein
MERLRMPNISPEEAVAALRTGLEEGGYAEFSGRIASDAKMFGDVVFHGLKSLFPGTTFERIDDLQFSAFGDEDKKRVANVRLGRHFNMLDRFSGAKCFEVTARAIADYETFVRQIVDGERPEDQKTLDNVVALIKHRQQVEGNNAEMARKDSGERRMASWQVVGDVMATAAFDLPTHYQFLTSQELAELDVGVDDIRDVAIVNIRRMMDEIGLLGHDDPLVPDDGGVLALGQIGGLASSIVLVDEFWKRQVELCGEPLCILLRETDEILVWRSSDLESGLGIMGALAIGAEKSILPGTLFFHDGEELRTLGPDDLENETVARPH